MLKFLCLISAGYTWCESSQSCLRQWETPCEDNFLDCDDCFLRQRKGQNIACPERCDMIAIDPMPPPMPPVYYPTGPLPVPVPPPPPMPPPPPLGPPPPPPPVPVPPPPPSVPQPPLIHTPCPEVMCMMYCSNGNMIDENGCQICQCNDPPSIQSHECPLTQPSCEGYTYVCPKITEITQCNMNGIDGYTTYQLSLVVQENKNVKNIYAIYGDEHEIYTMQFPPVYQSPIYQGQNIGGVSEYITNMFPNTKYDSWLTIGLTDGDPQGTISSIGIDFSEWDETTSLDINNGAVFLMDPSTIDLSSQGQEIVIAQITIPSDSSPTVSVNAQGKTIEYDIYVVDTESWSETNILFPIIPPVYNVPDTVPEDCVSWFDGCNTCSANNGILRGCTRMMCFREDTPRCLQYIDSVISGH